MVTSHSSHSFRMAGRVAAAVLAACGLILLAPGSASAMSPTVTHFTDQGSGTIDCGTFSDNFIDYFTITETTFYDEQGNATRVVDEVVHTSDDVNSVTGLTLHEHGHATLTFYPATGELDIDGLLFVMTRPTYGIVVLAVGRVVLDAEGNVVQISGHFQAEDQDYCNGLS